MRTLVTLSTCFCVLSLARLGAAEEETRSTTSADAREPDETLALAVGAATELLPFAAGVSLMATTTSRNLTLDGLFLGEAGFVAAPVVAHGVVGEWGRGLRFAVLPAIGASFLAGLVVARPSIVTSGLSTGLQYAFVLSIGESLFTSSLGVLDVTGATARQKQRLHVVPFTEPHGGGLHLVGTW